jgi:hypothetical protein
MKKAATRVAALSTIYSAGSAGEVIRFVQAALLADADALSSE